MTCSRGRGDRTAPQQRGLVVWRDPDSNWGHHDFQSCVGYSRNRLSSVVLDGRPGMLVPGITMRMARAVAGTYPAKAMQGVTASCSGDARSGQRATHSRKLLGDEPPPTDRATRGMIKAVSEQGHAAPASVSDMRTHREHRRLAHGWCPTAAGVPRATDTAFVAD